MSIPYILNTQNQKCSEGVAATRQADRSAMPGVLTHTVVQSPVVRWILPGRIRHETKNDVISVREDSIQIQELVNDIYLQDVTVKSDFDSTILSARLIGTENEAEEAPQVNETEAVIEGESLSPERQIVDPETPRRIPPQILVIATESYMGRYLLFLFAFHDVDGQIRFISHRRPLPSYEDHFRRLGVHLTVDPQSVYASWLPRILLLTCLGLEPSR